WAVCRRDEIGTMSPDVLLHHMGMPQPPAPAGPAESDASAHEVAPAPVDAQLDAEVDVVVAGGGTGGATAALAAAELGARVLVVERDTGLGGVGTRAGVHFYY